MAGLRRFLVLGKERPDRSEPSEVLSFCPVSGQDVPQLPENSLPDGALEGSAVSKRWKGCQGYVSMLLPGCQHPLEPVELGL